MSRNNSVFQVLVAKGNQAILAADNNLEDLEPGQLGVFDYETNLSIDENSSPKRFYLAVGLDTDGDGNTDDIMTSAGTHIQTKNTFSLKGKCYVAPQSKIIDFKNFEVRCGEDYVLNFELRNQQAYRLNGYNQVRKSFNVMTAPCDGCEDCPQGDTAAFAQKMAAEVNNDADDLISASVIAQGAITIADNGTSADYADGDVMSDADVQVIVDANEGAAEADVVNLGLRFEVESMKLENFWAINLNYFYPRGTDVVPVAVGNFKANGEFTVNQELVFEEGASYDVRQLEYEAGGFNGRPGIYRTSVVHGLPREGFEFFSEAGETYALVNFSYDLEATAGWENFKNDLLTVIAIPNGSTTTIAGLGTVLDGVLGDNEEDLTGQMDDCDGA